ncbi:hypothetical protein ANCCAN_07921 [Ancylostoma caninum]|uniref:Uncharacterized protein n=1 Tax=Ancylostoma caninum TaxID=29170 RepID=A0A368GSU0_ANCCA|nr:hypothetical protein ANCCAN_07921 [Ancylostoma caninum]
MGSAREAMCTMFVIAFIGAGFTISMIILKNSFVAWMWPIGRASIS